MEGECDEIKSKQASKCNDLPSTIYFDRVLWQEKRQKMWTSVVLNLDDAKIFLCNFETKQ